MTVKIRDTTVGKDAVRRPWIALCDNPECIWETSHKTKSEAEDVEQGHICPTKGKRSVKGKSLTEKMWDNIDILFDEIFTKLSGEKELDEDEVKTRQIKARGIALCLSMISTPIYRTEDDIIRQAMRRRKMRTGDLAYEKTHGYDFNELPPENRTIKPAVKPGNSSTVDSNVTYGSSADVSNAATKRAKAQLLGLSPQELQSLKMSKAEKLMSDQELAKIFGVGLLAVHICNE